MKKILYTTLLVVFLLSSFQLSAQNPGDSTDVYGCMDPDALNYNPDATIDLGYCVYFCDSTSAYFWFSSMGDSIVGVQSFAYSITEPISYLWDFGDGTTSSEEFPTHFYNEAGAYTLCLTVSAPDEDGNSVCTSTYCDSLYISTGTALIVSNDIYGCTDPAALNYNPWATVNDGSCIYSNDTTGTGNDIYGCTDPAALNYNFFATIDDGSCIYANDSTDIFGCMDSSALNYNPFATIDDGSCFYTWEDSLVFGCTDPMAINYNPWATFDDGSCIYSNDSTEVYGCTDPSAVNYNPLATVNDGSCFYFCDSTFAYFNVWDISEANGVITVVSNTYSNLPIISYLWDFGDGTTSDEQFPTHEYEEDGFYMLCLTITTDYAPMGNFNCTYTYCDTIGIQLMQIVSNGFTLNIISESATSIEEQLEVFKDINVYPNPANDQLNISYVTENSEEFTLSIYDLSGRMVKSWKTRSSSGSNIEQLGLEELNSGLYQIELRNNTSRSIMRFQVLK